MLQVFVSPVDLAPCLVDRVTAGRSTELYYAVDRGHSNSRVHVSVFQIWICFGILFFHYCLAAWFCDL